MICPICKKEMIEGYITFTGSSEFVPYNSESLVDDPKAKESFWSGGRKIVLAFKPRYIMSKLNSYYCKECGTILHFHKK